MHLYPYLGLHDPVSSLSHLLAAAVALGAAWLLHQKGRGDALRASALLIYSVTLLFLFSMSGVYHALAPGPWRVLFRRLDYAAIWLVIAGSATPVHILLFRGHWRWGLLSLFWAGAITCLVLIEVYLTRLPYLAVLGAYVGLASLGFVSFAKIAARFGLKETALLFLGGMAYAVGGAIDWLDAPVLMRGVFGPHELLHLFVIAGACMHWFFIYNWADGRSDEAFAAESAPAA